MNTPETILSDTHPVPALLNELQERRHACEIKTLYTKRGNAELARGEGTWKMGRIVNVSRRHVGLVLQRGVLPGAILCLEPLLPNWDGKEALTARVSSIRPGPGSSWFAGCVLTRALDDGELQILLNAA
jgi:hypothetical protein